MENLIEVLGADPRHRLLPADLPAPLRRHLDRHLQGGPSGALSHPGLQHPELALVDGELGVAHIPVVGFQTGKDVGELFVDPGKPILQGGQGQGVSDPRHHVLALGIDEEIAVGALRPCCRIAGEAHAGAGVVVAVAEDHGLDVDRGAQIVRDPLAVAVRPGPGPVPGLEHRLDGAPQLVFGVLRERMADRRLDHLLVFVGQVSQGRGGQLRVGGHAGPLLGRVERLVEGGAVDAENDAAVHRDEPAVGVVGEALVVGLLSEALDGFVIQAKVENRVHHAGHRELGPGPHTHQERIARLAELLRHPPFQTPNLGEHLSGQAVGPARVHVGPAGVGRDGEARGNR